jgi:hypothetical protein
MLRLGMLRLQQAAKLHPSGGCDIRLMLDKTDIGDVISKSDG